MWTLLVLTYQFSLINEHVKNIRKYKRTHQFMYKIKLLPFPFFLKISFRLIVDFSLLHISTGNLIRGKRKREKREKNIENERGSKRDIIA